VIPRRIKLKGFLCYKEEQQIEFDGNTTLWMLSGLNGTGKSAIFDAVTFALFAYHRGGATGAAELINKDSDTLLVEFDFLLDGQTYKAKRTIKRRANNTTAGTQQIFRLDAAGKWAAVEGTENKRDGFDPWVRDHIGLTYDTFTSSVLLLQGKAEKLLDSSPEGRRTVLASVVDLERYEKLHKAADDQRKALEAELKSLQNHLEALPVVEPLQLVEVRGRIEQAEAAREESRREVERLQGLEFQARAWQDLQARLAQAGERLGRANRLLCDAAAIEKDVRRLEELREVLPRLEAIVTQTSTITTAGDKIKLLTTSRQKFTEQCARLEAELKQKRDARQTLQAVIASDEVRQQKLVEEFRLCTARLEKLKEYERHETEQARLQAELARFPADPATEVLQARESLDALTMLHQTVPLLARFQQRRAELRQGLEREQAAQQTLQQVRARGESCARAVDELKPRAEEAGRVLQQANDQATEARTLLQHARDSVNDLNVLDGASKVCRACGQPITPGHIKEERRRRQNAANEAEGRHKVAQAKLQTARQAEQELREQLEQASKELQTAREEYRDALAESKQGRAEVERLRVECAQVYGEVPSYYRVRIGSGPGLDWPATEYPSDKELNALRSKAAGLATARKLLQKAEETQQEFYRLKTLEVSTQQTLARLRGELPPDPQEVRRQHTELETSQKALQKDLDARRGELKQLEREAERLTLERDGTRKQVDQAGSKIKEHELEQQNARQEVARIQKLLPPAWLPLSEKVGLREVGEWSKERDDLVHNQTDKRGQELKEARLNLDVLDQEKRKLEAESERFPAEARVEPALVAAQLLQARQADQQCDRQLIDARGELAQLENHLRQREKLEQQYLEKDHERNVQRLLAELLGKDRLQLYLVRQAERQVVEYANAVLDRLSGGQLYLRLSGEAEGDGTNARALELEAYNRGTGDKPINVGFLSGSQKFRVAVSLALGIGQYASRQHRPIESVIIDEGFGCLDRQGRQVMIQELQNLRGQMRCILLVSHQEEFADAFSDGYHFELANGATQVKRIQK
jgi:DNA repair exonuclease SbcCD ATPase subunit